MMGNVFDQLLILLIYISIGIYLRKVKKISKEIRTTLSILVVNYMMPCTIVSSFLNLKIDISTRNIMYAIFGATMMFIVLAILAKVSGSIIRIQLTEKGLWEFMIMFSNNIFIGFPMISALLGEQALVYASLACIPCNTLIFSYGIYLMAKGNSSYEFHIREIFNSCTLASLIAVVLLKFSIPIPNVLTSVIRTIGSTASPLALIVLGLSFADSINGKWLKEWKLYIFGCVKLIIAPIVVYAVLQLILKDVEEIVSVLVITAAMPASNIAVMMSEKYGNNSENATKCVTMSTLLFLITFPIVRILTVIFSGH